MSELLELPALILERAVQIGHFINFDLEGVLVSNQLFHVAGHLLPCAFDIIVLLHQSSNVEV